MASTPHFRLSALSALRKYHPGWIPFIVCIALRLFSLGHLIESPYYPPGDGDTRFYFDWAGRIAGGVWTDGQSFYGLPLYAYLLAFLLKVSGGNLLIPLIFQAIADALTAFLITDFAFLIIDSGSTAFLNSDTAGGGRYPGSWRIAAVLGGIGWCLYQPAQAFSLSFMPTTYAILVFWALVRWVAGWRSTPGMAQTLGGGVVIGLAATLVANILVLTPLLAIRLGMNARERGARTRAAAAACWIALGIVVGMAPCWMHNYFVAHERVLLSSHAGINLYIGNQAIATGYPKMPPGIRASQAGMQEDSLRVAEQAENRKLTRAEAGDYWAQQSRNAIRADPARWLRLLVTKLRNYWNAFQYDDISIIRALREEGVTVYGPGFALVAILGLPGLFVVARFFPAGRWVAGAIALHMVSLLPVFVTERYRSVVVPGLMIGAVIGLCWCGHRLATAGWRALLAWYVVPLAGSIWLVNLPLRDPSLWSLDLYNAAKSLLDAGRVDDAGEKAAKALTYAPGNAETNFLMGNVFLAKGDVRQAKAYYWTTINLDPTHARVWNNLGVLALDEQRWALAERFLTRAVTYQPNDAKSHYLLARARLALDDRAGALRAIQTALSLRPGQSDFVSLESKIKSQSDSDVRPGPKDE